MRLLVTAGPTYESLDQVRRLTNFSTGKLGTDLAAHLARRGHAVTLLRGSSATHSAPCPAEVRAFTTTEDLLRQFTECARQAPAPLAVFHAAAVSDFRFGAVYRRRADGTLEPLTSGKFGTRDGPLFAELLPTEKVISKLRQLFPNALLIGWKYEVEGDQAGAIALGKRQIAENQTDYCVVNGSAYGTGYGVTGPEGLRVHCPSSIELFEALQELVEAGNRTP